MADVTISSLPLGTPSGSGLIPFSQGGNTLATAPSGIVAASFINGSWVPTAQIWTNASSITLNDPNLTYSGTGTYMKINNMVYISFLVSFPSTTYDGNVVKYITGLPFPVIDDSHVYNLSLYEPRGFCFRYGGSIINNCKLTLSVVRSYGSNNVNNVIKTQSTDNSSPFSGWWQLLSGSGKTIGGSGWYITA